MEKLWISESICGWCCRVVFFAERKMRNSFVVLLCVWVFSLSLFLFKSNVNEREHTWNILRFFILCSRGWIFVFGFIFATRHIFFTSIYYFLYMKLKQDKTRHYQKNSLEQNDQIAKLCMCACVRDRTSIRFLSIFYSFIRLMLFLFHYLFHAHTR